jgi:2-polyprenyl-3-methyl-5-hydroxy-6-metoxy-1,4-benzoquinol methylase
MLTIHYNNCPACNSNKIALVLQARDETVSKEIFQIWQCHHCHLRFTQDVPNEDNIGKYYKSSEYISHTNTSKGLINKLYHTVRHFTLHSKRKLVEKSTGKTNGNLLEIGAGTGAFAAVMKKSGWNVTALEPDETARNIAQKDFGIQLRSLDDLFSLQPGSFDVITLWHVLEHVHQLHRYLDTFHSLLAKGGTLIIAVPNYTSFDAQAYVQNWAAYDVPRHLYHFSPRSMQQLLKTHYFSLKKQKPMWFDSFYVSLLSEKNLTGKNNYAKAFITGTLSNCKTLGSLNYCSSIIYIAEK